MTKLGLGPLVLPMAVAASVASCGGEGGAGTEPPTSPPVVRGGTASIALSAAPAGVAAVRLRVVGSGMSSPVSRGTARILLQRASADTLFFVLAVADGSAQPLLALNLANIDQVLTVSVQDVSAGRSLGYQALRASDVTVAATKQ